MYVKPIDYMFDFFSKTVGQIVFKLGGDVPWVDVYAS